jgi:hypothetical protein
MTKRITRWFACFSVKNGYILHKNEDLPMRFSHLPKPFHHIILGLLSIGLCLAIAQPATAFCGFFVARSEAKLDNSASRVVIVREGNKSIFTMANNFQGDVKDFARIVPIPVIPKREQVRIGDNQVIDQIDAFTAPRLALYVDDYDQMLGDDRSIGMILLGLLLYFGVPLLLFRKTNVRKQLIELFIVLCFVTIVWFFFLNLVNSVKSGSSPPSTSESVRVMDQFSVGEYDVSLLDATESNGLTNWLKTNDYKLPEGAEVMLNRYIQQGMKFFVVKVNLAALQKSGHGFLRPIVIEYESPKFMLPMRLGTLNATSDQDLTVYVLAPNAVAEVANYPTIPIPTDLVSTEKEASGKELPSLIKNNFGEFYQAVFQKAYEDAGKSVAFMEFAGQFGRCDPCSIDREALAALGKNLEKTGISASQAPITMTRLHVRYNQQTFPNDLEFRLVDFDEMRSRLAQGQNSTQQKALLYRTGTLHQGRYVIRETVGAAWSVSRLKYDWQMRHTNENLARLTGWSPEKIQQLAATTAPKSQDRS